MINKKLANIATWLMGSGLFLLCVPDWMKRLGFVFSNFFSVISIIAWLLIAVGFVIASASFFIVAKNTNK